MEKVILIHPEILGGQPIFLGTRVPVESLFDHLAKGYSIESFIDQFPTVREQQCAEVIKLAKEALFEKMHK